MYLPLFEHITIFVAIRDTSYQIHQIILVTVHRSHQVVLAL